ncbi:MAG: phenylpyruvate tautomerase PptA (4-oxalocrotonate tautomerase family) [Akkermansiaceae bacterium]|jgi:phenylpyruvate tautomerase PptA (4-oxalocrotonate tautomerase family)/ketosteroid isomerase-like protein
MVRVNRARKQDMPVIKVTLIEGYDAETITSLSRRMTDAVRATIAAPPDGITVVVEEVSPTNYMRGGRSRTPGAPIPGAAAVVQDYLAAMEERDVGRAKGHLHEDFTMTFPSGRTMFSLEELFEWSKTRYSQVGKTFEGFDEAFDGNKAIVCCRGTLHGAWVDGTPFEGIRFIDRFELIAGRIVRQEVWNDLSEHRPS